MTVLTGLSEQSWQKFSGYVYLSFFRLVRNEKEREAGTHTLMVGRGSPVPQAAYNEALENILENN
jgi:hypothetical protein